jgi:hypothetical protein
MKIFLPIVFLLSFTTCCSVFVGSKPRGSLPGYHEKLENFNLQVYFGKLHPEIKINLAAVLADLLYANFKRVCQMDRNRGKKDEDLIFETDQILVKFLDAESKDKSFESFMKQPSGFGTMNIYDFITSPEAPSRLYNCFADLKSTTVYDPLREPLNDMLLISFSFYFLRAIVHDKVKFLKFPKVYSHFVMLVSLCHGHNCPFYSYWDLLNSFLKNDCPSIPRNSRLNDAVLMLKLSSYWRFWDNFEVFTSTVFPFSSDSKSVEPDFRKFQTIAPMIGMGELKITLTSQRPSIYSYVLECHYQLYFTQFRVDRPDSKTSEDLIIDHGKHFIFPWIPESYILVALDRLENCDDLELEFKTVVELVQSNSPLLLLYLFNHNLALFRIPPSLN